VLTEARAELLLRLDDWSTASTGFAVLVVAAESDYRIHNSVTQQADHFFSFQQTQLQCIRASPTCIIAFSNTHFHGKQKRLSSRGNFFYWSGEI